MKSLQTIYKARSAALRLTAVIAGGVLFAAGPASASTIIDVEGTTLGCFGAGCSLFTSPAISNATYSLTFLGSPFDVVTDGAGSATNFVLGSLTRGNQNTREDAADLAFTLQVTFTLPTGINGGQADTFSALIDGTSTGGGGPLDVDFNNAWQLLQFTNASGSGSFEFSVINDPAVAKNNTANILGGIRNATFTENVPPPTTSVSEPAMLTLLGTGLLAVAYRRRRPARP